MTFAEVVAAYGLRAKQKLAGPGEREALLVSPVSQLVDEAGALLGCVAVAHDEVAELGGAVQPDFGVRVDGVLVGHIELKAPGTSLDPSTYGSSTHNYRQWQRLKELPNLLHTNGTEFRLWRYGELVDEPVSVHTTDLERHRGTLTAPGRFEMVVSGFLQWKPTTIGTVPKLVETLAPLARLLREEVHDALRRERRTAKEGADPTQLPFLGIAKDWRRLLFPQATDAEFSDGFAQTVAFALLLALSEGVALGDSPLHDVAKKIEAHHTLMGKALGLLTEHVGGTPVWTAIEIIARVLDAVDWDKLGSSGEALYLHLYEDFLAQYDPDKRERTGSYYTPIPVVDAMVRLTDNVLKQHMGRPDGLRNPFVSIVDPAMGTGTYPLSVLREVGSQAEQQYGPGAKPEAVSSAIVRTYGIEKQSGPFSVAELRISTTIRDMGAALPAAGLNLYVADTLEDPFIAGETDLSYSAQLIAQQRQLANKMKRERNIQVCIGNPPYDDHAGGQGGWIENGTDPNTGRPPLDAFKLDGNGIHERHLSNLYAYFWRWATWKVFESTNTPDVHAGGNGIVCFITATGYLAGPGFKGMRKYLRETCSHGWIINVTPEGKQPPTRNAVFNIETPVAIALFARSEGTDDTAPAAINYIDVHGTREEKFAQLATMTLDGPDWRPVRTEWTAPFTPAATTGWDDYPALDDLFPWKANGIMAGRGWIYAPSPDVLEHRLRDVINEDAADEKARKFINSRDASLTKTKAPLPGTDTEQATRTPFGEIAMLTEPRIVGCGYRVLDRQYVIADSRLMSQPSPTLWSGRVPGQVFAYELHSEYPRSGPAVAYTTLIPDVHYFRGSGGGRALPKLHPDGSTNTATGLPGALTKILGGKVNPADVFDYVAGVAGHSGFVGQFDDELHTPGVRIPITADRHLFDRAVILGRYYQWLHTYGEAGAHPEGYTDIRDHRIPIAHPEYTVPVGNSCPQEWSYEPTTKTLNVGPGQWTHVEPEAIDYTVGGANVLGSWLNYRLARPKKKYRSPLDKINATRWDTSWSAELSNLLSILGQLATLEQEMSELLTDILAGALLSRAALSAAGVIWPSGEADRRPRASAEGTIFSSFNGR